MILTDFLEPRQTINSDHYVVMLTKLKAQTFRFRLEKNTPFSCNTIMPGLKTMGNNTIIAAEKQWITSTRTDFGESGM